MGKSASTPTPPDPNQVASTQSKYDQNTALFNAGLNRYDVNTPFGSLNWNQTPGQKTFNQGKYDAAVTANKGPGPQAIGMAGGNAFTGKPYYSVNPDGSYNFTPPASGAGAPDRNDPQFWDTTGPPGYSQQITLNPTAQSTLDATQGNALNLADAQGELLSNVRQRITSPMNLDSGALADKATSAYYDKQMGLLQPQMDIQRNQMQTQLANQGIPVGSEGYNNQMGTLDRQQDFTRSQAADNSVLSGMNYDNQLFNQGIALRNQPLNEYLAMQNGTQIQTPQFPSFGSVNANAPNYQGAVQNQYQGQLNAYNAQTGADNSMTSGLMSMGAAAAMAF